MEFKGTKGKWHHSSQKGTINHCIMAQVWSEKQETWLANINSTENEIEATANAKLIAKSPELLEALYELLSLKKWKDEFGKDDWYLEKQPLAWSNAQKVLEETLT